MHRIVGKQIGLLALIVKMKVTLGFVFEKTLLWIKCRKKHWQKLPLTVSIGCG